MHILNLLLVAIWVAITCIVFDKIIDSVGVQWPSVLERRTGDRVVLSFNPTAATSLRNFGDSVYPALPVSLEETLKTVPSISCLCQGK